MSTLRDKNALLVPIHIDALVVGSLPSDVKWTNLAPDFSKLKDDYYFGSELVDPFGETRPMNPLEKGVHLHFRLPRAFTHGQQKDNEDPVFLPIPNRWLVQRFGGTPLAHKAWLIKSDEKAEKPDKPVVTWPIFPDNPEESVKLDSIGTCVVLQAPLDERDVEAEPKITALGPGNPAFSAHYPACRSVLGFHDALNDDVADGTRLSYLVTGWFSSAAEDPLYGFIAKITGEEKNNNLELTDEKLRNEIKERLGWICGESVSLENMPTRTLCHGLVRGIAWQGEHKNYFERDAADHKYTIAVGNSTAEALAALMSADSQEEALLTALQADLLSHDATRASLPFELHGARFGSTQGGIYFAVQPAADERQHSHAGRPDPLARGDSFQVPLPLQDQLSKLNAAQEELEQLRREFVDSDWQLHALWVLWTCEYKEEGESDKWKHLGDQVETLKKYLGAQKKRLRKVEGEVTKHRESIKRELKKHRKTPRGHTQQEGSDDNHDHLFVLTEKAKPPFQRPDDPVLAISGQAMKRRRTWTPPDGLVECRLSSDLVKGANLLVPGRDLENVTAKALFERLSKSAQVTVPEGNHRDILYEAVFLDGGNAETIARMTGVENEENLEEMIYKIKELQNQLPPLHPPADPNTQENNQFLGNLPDQTAIFPWPVNPWIPLFLSWEVEWFSDYESGSLAQGVVEQRWTLNNNQRAGSDRGELDAEPHPPPSGKRAAKYGGYTILSANTCNALADRLRDLGLDRNHRLIADLENKRILLQALDGFNEALIMQTKGLQLPPLDYLKYASDDGAKGRKYYIDPISNDLDKLRSEETYSTAPRIPPMQGDDAFFPIRCGRMRIHRLAVVDAFGQTVRLPVADINASAKSPANTGDSLLRRARSCILDTSASDAHATATASDEFIVLRPRFVEPMRLCFKWENASADTEVGGPVCGWIVPNHLEKCLAIYAAGGKPLGVLQRKLETGPRTDSGALFYWVDVPGAENAALSGDDDTYEEQIKRNLPKVVANNHLRYFCTYMLGLSRIEGRAFSTLLDEAIAGADQRVPEEDPGVSVLVGRTLALVRASVRFEMSGLPSRRPELRTDRSTDKSAEKSLNQIIQTDAFEKAKWPLRLGDRDAPNDGLIGLFKCVETKKKGETSADAFYPTWGLDGEMPQDFTIDCGCPLQVTMLMDPQARVHATTGALPRTFIELTPAEQAGSRRAREVFFQTAPVIGMAETPEMPTPSDDYGEWSWAYRPDVTHWKLDPKLVEATDRAALNNIYPTLAEGWLKLKIAPVKVLSFWVREGVEPLQKGTNIHLAWSLQGAESLELQQLTSGTPDVGIWTLVRDAWTAPPLPREYPVEVIATTTYRLIATGGNNEKSHKDLTVRVVAA